MNKLSKWKLPVLLFLLVAAAAIGAYRYQSFSQTKNSPSQAQSQKNKKSLVNNRSVSTNKDLNSSSIKYVYFFRGFAVVRDDKNITYPQGTYIIENNKDWHEFMDKCVPGIPYYVPLNFSKYYLVVNTLFPAKPTYSGGPNIVGFHISGNKLETNYDFTPSKIIYAQNVDGIIHVYVAIVEINKKYIPKDIEGVYHK